MNRLPLLGVALASLLFSAGGARADLIPWTYNWTPGVATITSDTGAGQLTFLLWQARADNTKARSELGIEFTPWEEGVRSTVRWMAESGKL